VIVACRMLQACAFLLGCHYARFNYEATQGSALLGAGHVSLERTQVMRRLSSASRGLTACPVSDKLRDRSVLSVWAHVSGQLCFRDNANQTQVNTPKKTTNKQDAAMYLRL
jgi:hypothetical protein